MDYRTRKKGLQSPFHIILIEQLLSLVLFVHFSDKGLFKVVKEFGAVDFSGFEFQKRMIEISQLNIKGAFKYFDDRFNICIAVIEYAL